MAFKKGQSGNPKGKPKGAMNKTTLAAQLLLDGEAQEITLKVIELAKQGNPMALKLCLERVLPPRKDRPISLKLPEVKVAEDVPQALNAILAAVSQGEITPSEAGILAGLVGAANKAIMNLPTGTGGRRIPQEAFEDPLLRSAYMGINGELWEVFMEGKPLPVDHLKQMIFPDDGDCWR